MPKKKQSRKKPKRRTAKSGRSQSIKVLIGVLFLIGFLIASLALLSRLRQSLRPPQRPTTRPAVRTTVPERRLPDLRTAVEGILAQSGATLDRVTTGANGRLLRFEMRGEFPSPEALALLSRQLRDIFPNLHLVAHRAEREISLFRNGSLLGLILFQPPTTPPANPPRVALIIDDMGNNMAAARQLMAIDLPLTFSILPESPDAARIATLAHERGHEVMIHIPMQPLAYPRISPGPDALYVTLTPAQIRRRLADYLAKVPYAVGANNHMGSRFTEDREGMKVVIAEMKKAGLFFIDSLTTAHSVAFQVARQAGVPAAVRDRFLDNVQDVNQISRQIRSLAKLAIRQGHAIGICHPHPQTLEALRREVPFLRQEGIEVVPVSQLLIR
jgi:polysaccharide deacetylase 2 family uncharacterized protein YibQ